MLSTAPTVCITGARGASRGCCQNLGQVLAFQASCHLDGQLVIVAMTGPGRRQVGLAVPWSLLEHVLCLGWCGARVLRGRQIGGDNFYHTDPACPHGGLFLVKPTCVWGPLTDVMGASACQVCSTGHALAGKGPSPPVLISSHFCEVRASIRGLGRGIPLVPREGGSGGFSIFLLSSRVWP